VGNLSANTLTTSGAATLGSLSLGSVQGVPGATATVSATTSYVVTYAATSVTLTLPDPSSLPGRILFISNESPQSVSSASANVIPLDGTTAGTVILPALSGRFAILVSNGTNYIIMAAN